MKQRTTLQTIAVTMAVALLAGCGGGGAPPSSNGDTAGSGNDAEATDDRTDGDTAPSNDGLGTDVRLEDDEPAGDPQDGGRLSVMLRIDATELDPHKMSETTAFVITEQVYESLLSSYRGELQPAIAHDWEVSDDGLTLTFHLRDNAYFHSGRQVTAEDVKYSIERIQDPETAAPRAGSYSGIEAIDVLDDLTVEMTLEEPNAAILTLLSTAASSIVDRDVVEDTGLNGAYPGGSGPFQLDTWVAGQEITLNAHDDYWEEDVPYLDGIDFSFNPDDNARAAAVRSGTVDMLWRPAPEFIGALQEEEDLKWYGGSGSLSLHLRLNTSREPFDDERVRQAIFLALDRELILDVANNGFGTALNSGYLPPDRFGALTEPIYGEPDLDRARELLAEAGYPDGFEAELVVISTSAFQVRSAEVEQQQLAEIGIDVTITAVEATIATERTNTGDFDMYQSGFGLTYDPDERFTASFTDGGGLNYGNWSDPEYEDLIAEARTELDEDARAALYEEAELILAERGPVAMTFLNADFDVVQDYVMGYAGDPTPTYRFYKYLWLDQ